MPELELKLSDGRTERVRLPDNANALEELARFLRREDPYDAEWVKLSPDDHRFVSRAAIVEISVREPSEPLVGFA